MAKNTRATTTLHDGDAEIVGQLQASSIVVQDLVLEGIDNQLTVNGYAVLSGTQKNQLNGYAGLDENGKLLASVIPAIGISSVSVVANQAAQIALTAQEGDVAVRTDSSKSFIKNAGTSGTISDWTELVASSNSVVSVAGKVGAVTLDSSDISGLSSSLAGKANTSHTHTASEVTDAGTAAVKNIPASGNASSSEVVIGSDTRLSNARTPSAHTHPISDVTGLQTAIDSTGTTTTNLANSISSLSSVVDGKAPASHTHVTASVTGLDTHLTNIDTWAAGTDSSISALQSSLASKANTSHTHTASQITDAGTAAVKDIPASGNASSTQVVLGNDTRLSDSRSPTGHSSSHVTGGSDALTASDIGALSSSDARIVTTDQKAGLVGSYGTPSSSNVYVTANDPRVAGAPELSRHSLTTAISCPPSSEVQISLSLKTAFTLWKVSTDKPARFRLYSTSAARTADTSRLSTVAPAAGLGLITEIITTSSLLEVTCCPPQSGANLELAPTSAIVGLLRNNDTTSDVVLNLTWTAAEA